MPALLPASVFMLAAATRAARQRTGDPHIGTTVKQGRITVVRVTYDRRGRSTVTALTEPLTTEAALDHLNRMGTH